MRIKSKVYGVGGYDKNKPNDNIVEIIYYTAAEEAELLAQEEAAAAKSALLLKLGITEEEAKLLLS